MNFKLFPDTFPRYFSLILHNVFGDFTFPELYININISVPGFCKLLPMLY